MRRPTLLDLVQAVVEVAPSHPEVAVWWYERASAVGALPVMVVLETSDGTPPDIKAIESELAKRLGQSAVAVRIHRAAAEPQQLYRLLTAAEGTVAGGRAEDW
jgi:hypothetical protein